MLKFFVFFPIYLLSSEVFILPQEADYFINTYTRDLLKAQKEVYIFSDTINDYSVVQALRELSKRNLEIYIISKDIYKKESKVTYLNLLKGVHLYTIKNTENRSLQGSYTCIDDKLFYLTTQSLHHTSLNTNHSFVFSQENTCKSVFTKLLKLCSKIK